MSTASEALTTATDQLLRALLRAAWSAAAGTVTEELGSAARQLADRFEAEGHPDLAAVARGFADDTNPTQEK